MQISCVLAPHTRVVAQARLAEDLGYRRVWVFDSPSVFGDVWITLARIAEATQRIGFGPAVLVPTLRHVMAQAAAIATLEQLAPRRLAVAVGSGFIGRRALGQMPLKWREVQTYVRQLRTLLNGKEVEIDGALVRMLHPLDYAPCFPIAVPILIAANGPAGIEVAKEVGDGIMAIGTPQRGFDWSALLAFGTVLHSNEEIGSPRSLAAVGPALTVALHAVYESLGDAVDAFPGGAAWRRRLEEVPAAQRHLALHEDHLVRVSERDRGLLNTEMLRVLTWTGAPYQVRQRIENAAKRGATEVLYAPLGPDIDRELRAFASAAGL